MAITAAGASAKTASDTQRNPPRREGSRYAAVRPTAAAASPTASMARVFSPANTARMATARPARTRLSRASQRCPRVPRGPRCDVVTTESWQAGPPGTSPREEDRGTRGRSPPRGDGPGPAGGARWRHNVHTGPRAEPVDLRSRVADQGRRGRGRPHDAPGPTGHGLRRT